MREIVSEVPSTDAVTFMFKDGSVVWVCFKPSTTVDSKSCAIARMTAQRFLDNLNPTRRWEGKIDTKGNVLESPINL
jgi:hypothetical protein